MPSFSILDSERSISRRAISARVNLTPAFTMTLILQNKQWFTTKTTKTGNTPFSYILGHSDLTALIYQLPNSFSSSFLVKKLYLHLTLELNFKICLVPSGDSRDRLGLYSRIFVGNRNRRAAVPLPTKSSRMSERVHVTDSQTVTELANEA
jgi:hypothetical protein